MAALMFAFVCLGTTAGCGDDSETTDSDAGARDAGHGHDAGHDDGHVDEDAGYAPVSCDKSTPRAPASIMGTGSAGQLKVKVVDADHDPARKYFNSWVIELSDAAGKPVSDAEFSNARTWMPVHSHDGKFPPIIMADTSGPGRYALENLNFTMTGPWEVQFEATSASAGTDQFILDVCVGD